MAVLVGFHVEGWDYLILRVFLARILGLAENDLTPDYIPAAGRGWQFVLEMVPVALKRFYNQCAQFAVLGIDNDGNQDLDATGWTEDPARPRHWNHLGTASNTCRWCQLHELITRTRAELNWLPQKPGGQWPISLVVPVEMIESWLLISQALVQPGVGSLRAEYQNRAGQKQRLYNRPEATREDVENIAWPLIRAMQLQHLTQLATHARSFADFLAQVNQQRAAILGGTDCWQTGDRGAER